MEHLQFADFHCDTILSVVLDNVDFSARNQTGHLDFPRLVESDFLFQCFAAFCEPKFAQEGMLRQTLRLLDACQQSIFSHPQVCLVTRGDFPLAKGSVAGLLAIEGAGFIGEDLFLVDLVHHMGVRLITLTWNGRNTLADGVGLKETAGGLTLLGQKAVKRMQELDIIVDLSHLAEKGFWDTAFITSRPLVASHSNAKALCQHPRNLTDQQIKEIGQTQGLIGLNLAPAFISESPEDRTVKHLARHAAHMAQLIGPQGICLGFDLDGISSLPQGMKDITSTPMVVEALAQAGFSPTEIRMICFDNLVSFVRRYLGGESS
jgi:membrane dipeptidase